MADDTPAKGARKSLSDGDIATYARRAGPAAGGPRTDADTHSDADAAGTDHLGHSDTDTATYTATDKDAPAGPAGVGTAGPDRES